MAHKLVVHCKKSRYDIYCGRRSEWGNPFRTGNRSMRIRRYRRYLNDNLYLLSRLHTLRGKVLGCWCAPKDCHCDVLATLANMPPITVLVTGDRYWTQWMPILRALCILAPGSTVVHGSCVGTDLMAGTVARHLKLREKPYPANWKKYGRAAGPIRNQQMLDDNRIDLVLAYHDRIHTSRGTADMIRRAQKKGIQVVLMRNRIWIRRR